MAKPWRPALGDIVRFAQYLEKFTAAEYEAAHGDELEKMDAKMLPNPKPDKAAMVIGVVSKSIEMEYRTDLDGENGRWFSNTNKRRTFYVLKRSIRGRRFLVPIEDLIRIWAGPRVERLVDGSLVVNFQQDGKTLVSRSRDDGATWTTRPEEDGLDSLPWADEARMIAAAHMITIEVIGGQVYGRCPYCSHSGVLLNPDPTGQEPFVCSDCLK